MPTCDCPVGTVIPTITPSTCPFDVKQIQKVIFQRQSQEAAPSVATAQLEATWTALKSASDDTKVEISPYVYDAKIAPGDAIVEGGGDNTTLNGIPIVNEASPSQFTGMLRQQAQSVAAAIRDFLCESVQVYFVNNKGQLIHDVDSASAVVGFPIEALFVGDIDIQGFGVADKNAISFYLAPEWADGLTITDGEAGFSFLTL